MGEGWSDFYARALLSSAAEDVNGIYSTGGWVTYQIAAGFVDNYYYGIRRFPYAVKTTVGANGKPHNPLTFADIDPMQINLSDGAFPPAFVGTGDSRCTTSARSGAWRCSKCGRGSSRGSASPPAISDSCSS